MFWATTVRLVEAKKCQGYLVEMPCQLLVLSGLVALRRVLLAVPLKLLSRGTLTRFDEGRH